MGKPAEAEAEFQQAIGLFTRLTLDYPSVPAYREELARAQNNLAIAYARQRQWAAAEAAWQQALAVFEKLAAEHPGVPDYEGNRGLALGNLGWLLRRPADRAEIVLSPWSAASAAAAVLAATEQAEQQERAARACERLERAMALERKVLERNKDHPTYLRALRDQSEYLAEARLILGRHAAAAEAAAALPAIVGKRGEDYYLAAELLARCAAQARADTALSEQKRREVAGGYDGQAVAQLNRGVALGCKDAARLRRPAFDELRGREDFRKVVAALK
jgi:hypothetical protein